jgi:hypothetical protein
MLFDFQIPNQGQIQFAILKMKAFAVIEKRIEKGFTLEAWIAWFVTSFNTAKEGLKCFINLSQGLDAHASLNCHVIRIQFSDVWNLFALVEKGNPFAVKFPCVPSFLNSTIVKITKKIEGSFQSFDLNVSGVNSKLIGPTHYYNYIIIKGLRSQAKEAEQK